MKRSVEAVTRKKARRSTDCITAHHGREARNQIPERLETLGAKGQNLRERMKVTKRNHVASQKRWTRKSMGRC